MKVKKLIKKLKKCDQEAIVNIEDEQQNLVYLDKVLYNIPELGSQVIVTLKRDK